MSLYEDPHFPLTLINPPSNSEIIWRRPKDIVLKPKFFGIQCSPVRDNEQRHFERRREIRGTSSSFFLTAVASLTKKIAHFLKIVPHQSFQDGYTGKFWFVFFNNGQQETVEIDDRLPTSVDGQLVYSKHVCDAFWFPLLEKAYAKFRGGYDNIATGLPIEAFYHLTGQKAEWFDNDSTLRYQPNALYDRIQNLLSRKCLVVCKQNDIDENNQNHGTGFVVTGTRERQLLSNDGILENRKFVIVRHPSGVINDTLKNELFESRVPREEGEGFIDVRRFLNEMQCVYFVELMDVLRRVEGVDPFSPLVLDDDVYKHRCKKH